MSLRHFISAMLLGLIVSPAPIWTAEPSNIDRTITKEPVYRTKAPKYCLLVFGLQADRRLWLVLDGDTLFVDTNGNGDLTEAGKKVKVETLGRETSFEEVDV